MKSGPSIERERLRLFWCGLIVAAFSGAAPAQAGITSLGDVAPHPATTTVASALVVGNMGTGTVIVTGGSDVVAFNANLGQVAGSLGVVQVSGNGSTWSMGQELVLGNGGDGIVQVNAGGHVQSASGSLGVQAGSNGTMSIDGDGSKWTIASNLIVGNSGSGSLTIADGGLVDLAGDLTLGISASGDSAINLDGGTLRLHGGALAAGNGVASFDFRGGRLEGVGLFNLANPFVQLGGTLAPGNSIGTTVVTSDYVLDGGQLELEINGLGMPGMQSDLLQVNGIIDLLGENGMPEGQLQVVLGFAPAIGNELLVLQNDGDDSILGAFASGSAASAAFGGHRYQFEILYNAGDGNDVALRTKAIHILGDFNGNGVVDAADYTVWRDGLGSIYTPADYDEWKSHFGQDTQSAAAGRSTSLTAAPEPKLGVLLASLILVVPAIRIRAGRTS